MNAVLQLLDDFTAAWNAHDVDALLACMTDDGVFRAAGPAPHGAEARGAEALRQAYQAIWQTYPDAQWHDAVHFVSGDRAVTEWRFTGTRADGTVVETRGCDIFLIRDGRIAVKDTFRKQVG